MFTKHLKDVLYKEPNNSKGKNPNKLSFGRIKDMNRHFSKEEIQQDNTYTQNSQHQEPSRKCKLKLHETFANKC
jgi:hypothetical protein